MSIISTLYNSKFKNMYADSDLPAQEKVDPKIKEGADYCKKVTQRGFAKLMKNRNAIPASDYDAIQMLRDYGTGNQSELYYQNKFSDFELGSNQNRPTSELSNNYYKNRKSVKRQGLEHINFKIISVAQNIKNAIHGMYDKYEEDIFLNAVDATSVAEEEKLMAEAYYDSKMRPELEKLEEQYGVPLTYDTMFPEDVTPEELESYRETGGFKSKVSEGLEQLIKHTEIISDWDRTIKRKFIDDGIDLNFFAARCVYNYETCKEKWEYVDPENFTIQFSEDRNFRDAEFAGYFTLEKISILAQMGFDSDKLKEAAKAHQEYFNERRGVNWNSGMSEYQSERWYYDYKVPVFHYSWIEADRNRRLRSKNKYGKEIILDIDYEYKVKPMNQYDKRNGIEREDYYTRIRNVYQCSWIVGTDMVYNYGRMPNQPRDDNRRPQIPFYAWKGNINNSNLIFGSITENCIPFYDNVQMAWLKYQDALIKSFPGGYALNLRLMENLQVGGKDLDAVDAYKMLRQLSLFPYRDFPLGEQYKGGSVNPITQIPGNMGELMAPITNQITLNLQYIEKFSGVNMVLLGSSPAGTGTATETQISTAGSQNILRPIIEGIFEIKEGLAYTASKRLWLLIKYNDKSYKSYEKVVGEDITKLLKETDHFVMEYGLSLEARPSDQELAEIMQAAQVALQRGRDGEASINLSQYMWIQEQIKSGGNVKMLRRQLDFMIRREQDRINKEKQQNIILQTQQQAQLSQQQAQNESQLKSQEAQIDMAIVGAKTQGELQNTKLKADLDLRNKQIENGTQNNAAGDSANI